MAAVRCGAIHGDSLRQALRDPAAAQSGQLPSTPRTAKNPLRRKHKPSSTTDESSRASRVAHTARIKQAFVASKELGPMAQQLATMRTPEAYAASDRLCAQPHRRGCGCGLPGAGPRVPARQALCRCGNGPGAGAHAPMGNWPTTQIFSTPRQATRRVTIRPPRTSCTALPTAIPTASSTPRSRSLRPPSCWPGKSNTAARQVLAAGRRHSGGEPSRISACRGPGGAGARPAAGCGITFKLLLLGHPLSAEAQIARAKLTELGAEALLTVADLRSLGRCLLQRRTLRRGGRAVSRTGARAGTRRADPRWICRGRGRVPTEAEAADRGGSPGAARHGRRKRRAAARSADGTGPRSRRHRRAEADHCRDGVPVSAQPVAGRRALLSGQHVPAQARLPDGHRVLRRSGRALSRRQERLPLRTGAPAG
jgi:hypothetical protein